MSSQTTDTPATPAVVPIEPDSETSPPPSRQDAFMHALAASEDAVSVLQVRPPRSLSITENLAQAYEVSLQFSESPPRVVEFAAAWDVPVTKAPHQIHKDFTYTEAVVRIRGVLVTAWTLAENENEDPDATVETEAPDDPDEPIPYGLAEDESPAGGTS